MRVGQILERVSIIDCGVAVGDLGVTPAFQRRGHHEQMGHAAQGTPNRAPGSIRR